MSDTVLPFPVLLTTVVAVVVSFMLILEKQKTELQCKHVNNLWQWWWQLQLLQKSWERKIHHNCLGSSSGQQLVVLAFGFVGSCNGINILNVSSLHTCFLGWITCQD